MTGLVFHHVGVVTSSLDGAAELYVKMGYRSSVRYEDPIQGVSIFLMRRADGPMIELISPSRADSPASGWLKRIKAGPYHTCYETMSLDGTTGALREEGFAPLMEPAPAVAFEGRPIVFMWSSIVGLVELLGAA